MTEIPNYLVWVVVGAIVIEGLALVVLTYLMWKASEKAMKTSERDPTPESGEESTLGETES